MEEMKGDAEGQRLSPEGKGGRERELRASGRGSFHDDLPCLRAGQGALQPGRAAILGENGEGEALKGLTRLGNSCGGEGIGSLASCSQRGGR